jgi:NAD(P)-dependent dehydrogenase (short-subunit alcohol dehydrogenase family)
VNNGKRDDMSFDGQQAVIIGASAGIGEATAKAFAAQGAGVVITGRSKERLDTAAQRIGRPVRAAEVDATDRAALDAFFATTGPVDHLVLAASPGAVGVGPLAGLDSSALRQAFDGKFFAHVQAIQAALPRLRAGGSVTIISAVSARVGFAGTAALARVNAVSPGIIDTAWWDGMPADQRRAYFDAAAAATPVGRVGRPEDVADAVVYLAGAGFVSGTVLECTGGAHLTVGALA